MKRTEEWIKRLAFLVYKFDNGEIDSIESIARTMRISTRQILNLRKSDRFLKYYNTFLWKNKNNT